MGTSSRSSSRTRRKSKSKGRKGNGFSTKTLKQVVKLGVTGMVARYVATLLVNIGVVSSVAGKIANIIGIIMWYDKSHFIFLFFKYLWVYKT